MFQSKYKIIIKENLIKNLLVWVCIFLFYPSIKRSLGDIAATAMSNLLSIISILIVTVSFANFAFTYEKINIKSLGSRFLAHSTTFLFLLITALLLEAMAVSVGIVYPSLYATSVLFSVLMYISIVLYDFWDLFRVL